MIPHPGIMNPVEPMTVQANQSSTGAKAKRLSRLGAIALSCVMVLTACAGGGGEETSTKGQAKSTGKSEAPGVFEAGSTMAAIQERGKLIVGIRDDAAPFSDMERTTGTWTGFDVEIAKEVATAIFGSQLEGKIEWVPLDPRDREIALEQRRVDIAMGRYAITVPRKRFVDFAGPYYIAQQEIVVPARSRDRITSIVGLNGKRICTILGSTNVSELSLVVPQADLSMQANTPEECAAALSQGEVDAFAGDHVDMLRALEVAGNDFRTLPVAYATEPYGIGVNKQQTDLRRTINDRLEKITSKYRDIFERTIQDKAPTPPKVDRY